MKPLDLSEKIKTSVHTLDLKGFARTLRRQPLLLLGTILVAVIIFIVLFGDLIAPYNPELMTSVINLPSEHTASDGH